MAKGYLKVTTTVTNPGVFSEYVQGFAFWIQSIGGAIFVKDMYSKTVEVKSGKFTLIIEFRSKAIALEAYKRAEYQELS